MEPEWITIVDMDHTTNLAFPLLNDLLFDQFTFKLGMV